MQEELKQRNSEMYEMNAKLIMLEYKGASLDDPLSKLEALQNKYDKLLDQNVRRLQDI